MTPQKDPLAFGQLVDDIHGIITECGAEHFSPERETIALILMTIRITQTMQPLPTSLNRKQVDEALGVSQPTIKKWIDEGRIETNECGTIPTNEVFRVAAVNRRKQRGRAG